MARREYTPPPVKCWSYNVDGFEVMAGKTDADNDQLSLRIAHANDYWFHVKGMPGSHVILRVEGQGDGREPNRRVLEQAAAVAAYHSKARGGGVVAVNMTLAQNVTKPKGAPPGTVQIRREKTLKVRPALPESSTGEDS